MRVQVFDMLGREVMSIPVRRMNPGADQEIQLDASRLSSGTYLYRVIVETRNDPTLLHRVTGQGVWIGQGNR